MSLTTNQSLRNAAQRMLQRLGMDGQLVIERRMFDKAENRAYDQDPEVYALKCSPPTPYIKFLNGAQVITEDLSTLVAAQGLAVVPAARNKIRIAGKLHSVVAVSPIYGGNDPVAYELRLSS